MAEIIGDADDPPNTDIHVRVPGSNADTKNTETVQDRLRQALKAAGGNKAVSQKSGLPGSTIDYALSAGSMRLQTAQQLAAATGVRLEWLASGEGPMRSGGTSPPPPEPPPSPPAKPAPLFSSVNMDRLADAYAAARQLLAARGIVEPRAIDLVRIMSTIYDELTDVEGRDRTS